MMRCDLLSAIVLTYNEAPNIRRCLESVQGLCDVFVVDSGSTDGTPDICREYTARVFEHTYRSHADQWSWALDNLPVETEWVLALDADFTVTPELWARLAAELAAVPADVAGIYVRHRYRFGGSLIRFGGTKQYWLRLIRRGRARADPSELVDFRFDADGRTLKWRQAVIEYNRHDDDISTWIAKQDKFSLRLAVEEELRRTGKKKWSVRPKLFGHTDERIAWLRDRWLHLPLFVRPVLYFIYRYVLALGFLDGRGGFLYHFLQGMWFRMVVDWKTLQLRTMGLDSDDLDKFAHFCLSTRIGSVSTLQAQWNARRRGR